MGALVPTLEEIEALMRRVVREELVSASEPEWLTTEDAAELRKVTPKTIRAWTKAGLHSEVRRRRVWVRRADVLAYRGPDSGAEIKMLRLLAAK